jgi:hypothetical protein
MRDWLVEIVDQIALGEFLAISSISCGQRFGLIAVDNAVEFMLIAHVEVQRQLVGGHKGGGITKKDWDEIKRQFPKLLSFVVTLEPKLQPLEVKISRYHEFRNSLYHSGTPVTTSPDRVTKYSRLTREVLGILFGIQFSPDEWDGVVTRVADSLTVGNVIKTIKRQITYEEKEGIVKFSTSDFPTATEAIALCLHGYSIVTGAPPSRPLLTKSLAMSGHPLGEGVINVRLSNMRKAGWIQRNELTLAAKGRKGLAKKYLI